MTLVESGPFAIAAFSWDGGSAPVVRLDPVLPEIGVSLIAPVADGDTTPNLEDGTDFGITASGVSHSRFVTIESTGAADLEDVALRVTGADAAAFSFADSSQGTVGVDGVVDIGTLPMGSTARVERTFDTGRPTATATLEVWSNDTDEGFYEIAIAAATGTVPNLIVTTPDDVVDPEDGERALGEAITVSNANDSGSTITFASGSGAAFEGGGTITLGGEQLTLAQSIAIDGDLDGDGLPDVTLDAGGQSRVIDITGGTAALSRLTLTNGQTPTSGNDDDRNGGGIRVAEDAELVLATATLSGNRADLFGGGIFNRGTVTLTETTLSGNSAALGGGGIYNAGDATLTEATLSGNSAAVLGGGIFNYFGTLTLTESTLSGNRADERGGGIETTFGTVTLANTIVLGNDAGNAGAEIVGDHGAAGPSIVGGVPLEAVFASVGANPDTGVPSGVLADNGGPVETVLLRARRDNPALDAGDDALAGATDARGLARLVDQPLLGGEGSGVVDLGAVELGVFDQAPVAADDALATDEDTGLAAGLFADTGSGADVDPNGDDFDVVLVNGAASVGAEVTLASGALVTVGADGTLAYDPAGAFEDLGDGESRNDIFTYSIDDASSEGGPSQATVTVRVTGVNDAPVLALPDAVAGREDTAVAIPGVAVGDVDDARLTVSLSAGSGLSLGTTAGLDFAAGDGVADTAMTFEGAAADLNAALGGLVYRPPRDASGPDAVAVTVRDPAGAEAAGTIPVTVAAEDDPVLALDDAARVGEDGPAVAIDVLGNDVDVDDDGLAVAALDLAGTRGTATVGPDGRVLYDPAGAFDALAPGEEAVDVLGYRVTDGSTQDTGRVTITVTGAEDAPEAVPDAFAVPAHVDPATLTVLANDRDPEGAALAITGLDTAGLAGAAAVTPDGRRVLFTPGEAAAALGAGESLETAFAYTVSDGTAEARATVTLTLAGPGAGAGDPDAPAGPPRPAPNAPPDARDDRFEAVPGAVLAGDLLADNGRGPDTDPDGGPLAVTGIAGIPGAVGETVTLPSGARLSVGADGRFAYDPAGAFDDLAPGARAGDSFSYLVADGQGAGAGAVALIALAAPAGTVAGTGGDDAFVFEDLDVARIVEAGAGADAVTLPGAFADLVIEPAEGGFRVRAADGSGAPVELRSVETIRLDDATLEVAADAGTARLALVYDVSFDREFDIPGITFWRGVAEAGLTLPEIAAFFPESPEFAALNGPEVDDRTFVEILYANAFGAVDPEGAAFWADLLTDGAITRGETVLFFADSPQLLAEQQNTIDDGILLFA